MRNKVLLVGWDSADWKVIKPLIENGLMPQLARVCELGVMGNLATLRPILSPMLWTSIATGKRAYDHGVLGFTEVDPITGQIRPVTAATRTCKAVWNLLAERGLASHVVSWFATHGEQIPGGMVVSNLFQTPPAGPGEPWTPPPQGTIWPSDHAAELVELRVSPEEIEPGLIEMFAPDWRKIDQSKDNRLIELRIHLAETLSVHNAATWILEHQEWDFLAVYYRAIDEIAHHFMPFHPPRLDGVPADQFEVYKGVVNGSYRFHDLLLSRLIHLAGPDAHVILVSDHGFHSDHLRPKFVPRIPAGITIWHRPYGIFAAVGPQFAQDELVFGASLLDVTPTVLTLFGLPVGEDMEGKVLTQALRAPPAVATVSTWEETEPATTQGDDPDSGSGSFRSPPRAATLSDDESRALLDQFVALGYIDRPSQDPSEAARATNCENQWSLARAYLDGNRPAQALPILEELHHGWPHRVDFGQVLARCQLVLGLADEAQRTIDAMIPTFGEAAAAHLLQAEIAYQRRRYDDSLTHLELARAESSTDPLFWFRLGLALMKRSRWSEAETALRHVIELDEDDAAAWQSLAVCCQRQRRRDEAVEAALQATSLNFALPQAHLVLARAMIRSGELDRAEQALSMALRFAPKSPAAHQIAQVLYRKLGESDKVAAHTLQRQLILDSQRKQEVVVEELRVETAERAARRGPVCATENNEGSRASTLAPRSIADTTTPEPLDITLVSGLPRSGTSLMMQLLQSGGYPVLSDGLRQADENNERGYLEWEDIRKLPKNPRIIERAAGKAVKVISALLPSLPRLHRYKIIFMRRPLTEIALSQHKMRFRQVADPKDLVQVLPILEKHLQATLDLLRHNPQFELLEVDYPALIGDRLPEIQRLLAFLGREKLPHATSMASVVQPKLYRERSASAGFIDFTAPSTEKCKRDELSQAEKSNRTVSGMLIVEQVAIRHRGWNHDGYKHCK